PWFRSPGRRARRARRPGPARYRRLRAAPPRGRRSNRGRPRVCGRSADLHSCATRRRDRGRAPIGGTESETLRAGAPPAARPRLARPRGARERDARPLLLLDGGTFSPGGGQSVGFYPPPLIVDGPRSPDQALAFQAMEGGKQRARANLEGASGQLLEP